MANKKSNSTQGKKNRLDSPITYVMVGAVMGLAAVLFVFVG